MVENAPDIIARFDKDLRCLYINSAVEKELGVRAQSLTGRIYRGQIKIVQSDINIEAELRKTFATGQERRFEYSHQTNQVVKYYQARCVPEFARDGSVESILVVTQDITQARSAENALRQQMERERLSTAIVQHLRETLNLNEILTTTVTELQNFLQADRVLVYQITNQTGKVVAETVAPGYTSLLHKVYPISDIDNSELQPSIIELPNIEQVQAKLVVPIIQHNNLWGALIVHQCSSTRTWQAWESNLLQQIANQLAIAILQSELYQQLQAELRERFIAEINLRQSQQALLKSEQEFRSLSESSPVGIFRTNARGECTYTNPRFHDIYDYTFEENWKNSWLNLLHQQDIKQVKTEIPCARKDSSIHYCQVQAAPIFDTHSKLLGYVGTLEDITESRAISQMKSEFISIVSHELRTPLTSLRGSLELLKSGIYDQKPDKGKRMLQVAADSAARLVRLVNDILNLERLESGKIELVKESCNAATIMQQSVELMLASALENNITLSVTPLEVQVHADADAIIQTLTNLLSNAIKFSEPGTTVWLNAELQGEYVLFWVKDSGRGIPPDKLETIFGQFQQVDASDSRQKGGTGLGLAICRSIIRQHECQIWAESILGEGSTFYFTLPLAHKV